MAYKSYLLAGSMFAVALTMPGTARAEALVQPAQPDQPVADQPVPDQPDSAQPQAGGIEDIVVTARRTSENLQTTPVAVTAQTGEDIERQGLVGVQQLQNVTPNLSFSSAVSQPGSSTVFIRGQGSSDGLIAIDQAVGAYLNGVYLARSTGSNFDMIDVARVEVLRGPQGTLFGRNTTGGAINVIPNEPTADLEGSFRVDVGNYDTFLTRGVFNIPLRGDEIGIRIAGQHREHSGYVTDAISGRDLQDANSNYIRGTLRIAPSGSGFTAVVVGDYSDFNNNGEGVGLRSLAASAPTRDTLVAVCNGTAPVPALNALRPLCPVPNAGPLTNFVFGGVNQDFYRVFQGATSYGRSTSWGISATLSYQIADEATIKSITAWRSVDLDQCSDNDGTPYLFTGCLPNAFGNRISQDQFSQEVQLSGSVGIVDYILGGFYFVENGTDVSRSGSLFPLSTAIGFNDGTIRNQSLAGYGQLIVRLTDTLRVTGGLRYTEDTRELVSRNRNLAFTTGVETSALPPQFLDGDASDPFRATFERSFNYVSWLGSIDWRPNDNIFVYAKISRSQRSGGFNTRVTAALNPPLSFRPEEVTDYEVGAKLYFLDRRVRFNIAAFNDDVNDVQRNLIGTVGTSLISGVDNAASARIRGVEVELTVAPGGGFTFGGTLGYTNAQYTQFINSIDGSDWSDAQFPYTPEWTWSVSADYERQVGSGTFRAHVDYGSRTEQYATPIQIGAQARVGLTQAQIDAANVAAQSTSRIPGYSLLNARISYTFDDPNIEVAIYGQNILAEEYITRLLSLENTPFGLTSYLPGDPATYGVSATFRF